MTTRVARLTVIAALLAAAGSPAAADPATIPAATALRALAVIAHGFDENAIGDKRYWVPAAYWGRAIGDVGNAARRLGDGMVAVAGAMPAGAERAVVNALGRDLAGISWPGVRGDADFWKAHTVRIVREVRRVGDELDKLAPPVGAVPAGVALQALGRIAEAVRLYDAPGDWAHWRAASDVFAMVGRAMGRGLEGIVPHVPAALRDLLQRACGDLDALESTSPYNDPEVWMTLASREARLIGRAGNLLRDLGAGL